VVVGFECDALALKFANIASEAAPAIMTGAGQASASRIHNFDVLFGD
jgi:hypothetical protein